MLAAVDGGLQLKECSSSLVPDAVVSQVESLQRTPQARRDQDPAGFVTKSVGKEVDFDHSLKCLAERCGIIIADMIDTEIQGF